MHLLRGLKPAHHWQNDGGATFLNDDTFQFFYFVEFPFANLAGDFSWLDIPDGSASYHVNTIHSFHTAAVAATFSFSFGCNLCLFSLLLCISGITDFRLAFSSLLVNGSSLFFCNLAIECTTSHGVCYRANGIGEHTLAGLWSL